MVGLVLETSCISQAGATGIPVVSDASGKMDRRYLRIKQPVL
jgi:hypothetical protein